MGERLQQELSKLVNYNEVQYQRDVDTDPKRGRNHRRRVILGFIKILAKTYGNYFFVMQSVKVLKNMKKDDNALVGFGKVLLADKLMDVAQWLAKPDDKE